MTADGGNTESATISVAERIAALQKGKGGSSTSTYKPSTAYKPPTAVRLPTTTMPKNNNTLADRKSAVQNTVEEPKSNSIAAKTKASPPIHNTTNDDGRDGRTTDAVEGGDDVVSSVKTKSSSTFTNSDRPRIDPPPNEPQHSTKTDPPSDLSILTDSDAEVSVTAPKPKRQGPILKDATNRVRNELKAEQSANLQPKISHKLNQKAFNAVISMKRKEKGNAQADEDIKSPTGMSDSDSSMTLPTSNGKVMALDPAFDTRQQSSNDFSFDSLLSGTAFGGFACRFPEPSCQSISVGAETDATLGTIIQIDEMGFPSSSTASSEVALQNTNESQRSTEKDPPSSQALLTDLEISGFASADVSRESILDDTVGESVEVSFWSGMRDIFPDDSGSYGDIDIDDTDENFNLNGCFGFDEIMSALSLFVMETSMLMTIVMETAI